MSARPCEALRPLLPPGAVGWECRADDALLDLLHPAEREVVAKAVRKRRAEFAAGRLAARAALRELSVPDAPLLPGPDRAPRWPAGVVGAIAHAGDLALAVAAAGGLAGLGVDLEPDEPIEEDLWPSILTAGELARLADRPDPGRAVRMAFTAKEAAYKCLHPVVRRFVGFHEVEVHVGGAGTFTVAPAARLPEVLRIAGRYTRSGGFAISLAHLPA